ncbi:MAG: pyruvate kinase [Candidatus Acididesulfobacter diazotrophicus]|uniref:Pyruvate kinase n=1 Tax=Candidatus Acididesulfobacter diazotrophicus TaxID=2597226 RepID=A0A519BPE1_9DELT|nr:MAG: pyruvate kinase [Candidatus Acididesulfobacter diazotrophicus]
MYFRKTKIVCTLGPASSDKKVIKSLIESGMNVARLNFSHGDEDTFESLILTIRELSNDIAILIDLPGPKIRTGKQLQKEIVLKKNSDIILSNIKEFSDEKNIAIDYKYLTKDVERNNLIFIDDGKIKLKVLYALNQNELLCKIIKEGILKTEKGVNFPNVSLSVPSVTDNDFKALKFGAEHNADMFAVSFVRKSDDIETVKNFLEINYPSKKFFIISKIEKSEAIENIYKITEISDGIMVARGDLGVETPIETIALKQKMIISVANSLNKPVITATQMLESMVSNESPTRAEVTDITNALLDGTDAVMLSEETAVGLYSQLSAECMEKIIATTEGSSFFMNLLLSKGEVNNIISNFNVNKLENSYKKYENNEKKESDIVFNRKVRQGIDNISYAAAKMAVLSSFTLEDSFIAAITRTGYTANLISSFRPIVPIIAIVPDLSVKRRLALNFGVISLVMEKIAEKNVQIEDIVKFIKDDNSYKIKNNKKNNQFRFTSNFSEFKYAIITGGLPIGEPGSTDFVRIIDLRKN